MSLPYPPIDPISALILILLDIYKWIVIAAVVVSWLIAFNVVNMYNQVVRSIVRFLDAVTEPVFRLVRRFLPAIGGIDLSPIVVFIAIWFVEAYVIPWVDFWIYRSIG
jgi:YggT family protein